VAQATAAIERPARIDKTRRREALRGARRGGQVLFERVMSAARGIWLAR
jgi:hypothetical protein